MYSFYCHGGPFEGETIRLDSPTTVVFTAAGSTGRYRSCKVVYTRYLTRLACLTPVPVDKRFGFDLMWEAA